MAGRYSGNDLPATEGKPRPDYQRLMAAAGRGEFNMIIVFQTSRFWRNRKERAAGIEILQKTGVSIALLLYGTEDEVGVTLGAT